VGARHSLSLRFRALGVPVRVHPTFWLMMMALGANLTPRPLSAAVWLATVFGVLLVGELAIARSLASLGYAPTIWLHWAGAETTVALAKPRPAAQLCAAYASGPLAVLILAGLAAVVAQRWPSPYTHGAVWVATFWAFASLAPMQPLVGGKILRVLLTRPLGARAETAARVLSLLLALAALAFVMLVAWSFAAFLLVMVCLWVNASSLRQGRLAREDASAAAQLAAGYAALYEKGDGPARAQAAGEELARTARSTAWKARARELVAWAHLVAGRLDAAEAALERLPPGTEPDPLLEGSLYLALKEWDHAAVLLADALAKHENDDAAARLAHALLQQGRLAEALGLADRPFAAGKTLDQLVTALFYAGRLGEARALGLRWWALEKHPRLAFNLACIASRLSLLDEACRYIDEAVTAGWRDLRLLDEDPDLEPLRKRPEFHHARARLTSLGRVGA